MHRHRSRSIVIATLVLTVLVLMDALAVAPAEARVHHVEPMLDRDAVAEADPVYDGCACDTLWADSILYRLELPGTVFEFGDTIRMVYRITNHRSTEVVFTFGSTCQEWFGIYPDSCGPGQPDCASTWHSGWGCYTMETHLVVEPGESAEYILDWRQHTDEGYRVPSGSYTAYGTLQIQDLFYQILLSVPFTIVPYGPQPIQEALDDASAGDTVLVAPGVYYENLVLLNRHAGVVLKSEGGPEMTVLDGGGRGSVVYAYNVPSTTTIEGFTIRRGRTARSSEFYDAGTPGGGVTLLSQAPATIRHNIIRDNESTMGGGITVNHTSYGGRIEENLFLDNTASDAGGGVYVALHIYNPWPRILRCTFVGNHAREGGGVYDGGGSGARLEVSNCVFYENEAEVTGGGLYCHGAYNPTVNVCNDFWRNIPNDMTDCGNAVDAFFADPLFCASDIDDYTLQDTSPCAPLNNPECGQVGAYGVGCSAADAAEDPTPGRAELVLGPNPAHGDVRILLPAAGGSSTAGSRRMVEIRTIMGSKVWWERVGASQDAVVWDGRTHDGRFAPSGIYLVVAKEAGKIVATRTLVRLE